MKKQKLNVQSVGPSLRLDWCSHKAAKYAVEHWHYSGCMPSGKTSKIGVWEKGKFVGVVIFSRGATPHICSPYKLTQYQACELTRIALSKHHTPVSKILSISLRFLKKYCPGVRLIVSYADADQNHYGGIYQATNWIYEGLKNKGARSAFIIHGEKVHPRSIGAKGGIQSIEWVRKNMDPHATEFKTSGKHKYLMPLDKAIRKQIEPLAKPYPKRCDGLVEGQRTPSVEGGSTPTPSLQYRK